jgi:hypothetical protein
VPALRGDVQQPLSSRSRFPSVARPADPTLGPSPSELDPLIGWLGTASDGLVHLEPYQLSELRAMVQQVARVVAAHSREYDARLGGAPPPGGRPATWAFLRADHAWFSVSLEQLAWFFGIVENEDHGGHRQAMGQYGRLLAEALRRHRDLEREYFQPPT